MSNFATRRAASLARPPVDLRPLVQGAIRDQGSRPLCVPLSVSAAHQAARARLAAAVPEPLTPEPLWAHCMQSGRVSPLGTTMAAVGDALAELGQPPLSVWPYNPGLGVGTEMPPAAAAIASWYKTQAIELPLAHDGIEDLLEDVLASSVPVVVVIEVTAEFENAAATGEISVPSLRSPVGDYHAVVALGAATNADTTLRRVLIHNTWGDGWGAGGYGWLPLDYLIAFSVQAAILDPASLQVSTAQVGALRTLGTDRLAAASVAEELTGPTQKGA